MTTMEDVMASQSVVDVQGVESATAVVEAPTEAEAPSAQEAPSVLQSAASSLSFGEPESAPKEASPEAQAPSVLQITPSSICFGKLETVSVEAATDSEAPSVAEELSVLQIAAAGTSFGQPVSASVEAPTDSEAPSEAGEPMILQSAASSTTFGKPGSASVEATTHSETPSDAEEPSVSQSTASSITLGKTESAPLLNKRRVCFLLVAALLGVSLLLLGLEKVDLGNNSENSITRSNSNISDSNIDEEAASNDSEVLESGSGSCPVTGSNSSSGNCIPSPQPIEQTTAAPTIITRLPTASPSLKPLTAEPTQIPTTQPAMNGTQVNGTQIAPDQPASNSSIMPAAYYPGDLVSSQHGLLLSRGLQTRIVGTSGEPVAYFGAIRDPTLNANTTSNSSDPIVFHGRPDFGATFADERPWNVGGWIYTSNSEMAEQGKGGVGAITFDKDGNVIDYRMVLTNTTMNCAGGRTPWNTWISCEEVEFTGKIYQVDPTGARTAERTTMGSHDGGGRWESFAYDIRDTQFPRFFATEDAKKGTTRRFTPDQSFSYWKDDPWNMLHGNGTMDFLMITPYENQTIQAGGTYIWTSDIEKARNNARSYYPQTEGIDVDGNLMYITSKGFKQLFIFDLDSNTYVNGTTVNGLFDGQPDQVTRVINSNTSSSSSMELLYFCEEGGNNAGVHARDDQGRFFTILESPIYMDETTGLSFSPNGKHMYVAYQGNGLLFDVWREDGLPFDAKTLNVKYHQMTE